MDSREFSVTRWIVNELWLYNAQSDASHLTAICTGFPPLRFRSRSPVRDDGHQHLPPVRTATTRRPESQGTVLVVTVIAAAAWSAPLAAEFVDRLLPLLEAASCP